MPGSNDYSVAPELRSGAQPTPALVSKPAPSIGKLGDPYTNLPKVYTRGNFEETALKEKYGSEPSRRDRRQFKRYLKSDAGIAAKRNYIKEENVKEQNSYAAYAKALGAQSKARMLAAKADFDKAIQKFDAPAEPTQPTQPSATPLATPSTKPTITPRSDAEWNRIASENGFKDMAEVKAWQAANGLVDDGKFGNNSSAYFKANGLGKYQRTPVEETNSMIPSGYVELSRQDGSTFLQRQHPNTSTDTQEATPFDLMGYAKANGLNDFYNHGGNKFVRHDPFGAGDYLIGEDGKMYKAGRWGSLGEEVNSSNIGSVGSDAYNNYQKVFKALNSYKGIANNKQGGTMNRINYFQHGGAAPQQQDVKAQVTALVQAAMQGDQKATQQVNQIMEAAKAGDQQAMQIAQIMEQVVKEMQGQAVAAKYGTKLSYLQSLKCGGKSMKKKEQGGKVCPACEQVKQTKKPIISKHQSGGSFYRNWSPEDVRKLQLFLTGYNGYEGNTDGAVTADFIENVKAYQRANGFKDDGMWGYNTNQVHRVLDSDILKKGSYKPTHKTEQGNLRTYDVAGKKMKENDYYRAVNNLKEQFYADPEAFWNAGGDTAKWREHLYTTPEGTAIMEEFYGATPDDVKKKLGSRVTNRRMQQDQMDSGIREATGRAANVAVTKVLPAIAGIAAAPAVVMNPLAGLMGIGGAYAGGAVGRQVGENLSAGDTSTWTSVDGMGNVASVATPTSDIVVPVTEALGAAAGGFTGYKLGQNVGKPSLEGMRAEHGKSPRLHNRKSTLKDYKPRAERGDKGKKRAKKGYDWRDKPVVVLYQAPAGGNTQPVAPAESPINFENLSARKANGGSIERKKYFSWI